MSESREREGWHFWHWLGLAAALYVIPCIVLLVDSFMLSGDLFDGLPRNVQSFIEVVYWPVEQLFDALGWTD